MKQKRKRSNKVTAGWRLDPQILKAIDELAREHQENQTWVVERLLSIGLGLRPPIKPLPINEKIEIA